MVHLLIKSGRQSPDDTWDKEFEKVRIEMEGFNDEIIQDSGDIELLSDDRKDLRQVTRAYSDAW
jgi:hypothetical protein